MNPLNPFPIGGVMPLYTTIGQEMPEGAWWSAEAADKAVAVIQKFKHTQGPLAGEPFILSPEQVWLVREAFGWLIMGLDGKPQRVVRTVYVEMGRANGKSQLGAGIAGVLLYADGETAPEVVGAAKDRKQARIILNRLKAMVRSNPDFLKRSVLLRGEIRHKTNDGWYEATSADVASAWGGAPHGLVVDEIHAQPNRDLWDALVTGTGKRRQPMVWGLTTAGWDRESLCWELHSYVIDIAEGKVHNPAFMGVIWAAPEDADWTDPAVWQMANPMLALPGSHLTPSGAVAAIQHDYLRAECEKALHMPAFQNTFRTMYLSQWVGQETRFIDMAHWDACTGSAAPSGKPRAYGGLDLASTTDLAAFSVSWLEGGEVKTELRLFAPAEGIREKARRDRAPYDVWARDGLLTLTPGAFIDQDYIRKAVAEAAERFDIADIGYDRWNASQLVVNLTEDGHTMVPLGQGFATMSAPTKELLRLVTAHTLAHGGNPALRWMVSNTAAKTDPAGNIKPDRDKSSGRIDGVVSTIMSIDGVTRRGSTPKRRSAYEDRGLRLA